MRLRTTLVLILPLAVLAACARAPRDTGEPMPPVPARTETLRVELASGATTVDVYLPVGGGPAPLVLVAHGFSRSRANMSGWGAYLADAGYIAAVPDLPYWSDHARNGRFLADLRDHLLAADATAGRADPERTALMGFSAGGLSSFLAAVESAGGETPPVVLWIGLDPVDRGDLALRASDDLPCPAVVLAAEPSSCNANGNWRPVTEALGARCRHVLIPGATHTDPEWPTTRAAELFCGASTEENRTRFRVEVLRALEGALTEQGTE